MTEEERRAFYDGFVSVPVKRPEIAKDERGNLRMRIVGKHPHSGREGVIECSDGKVTVHEVFGADMYEIRFSDGQGCFAEQKNLQPIYEAPSPSKRRRR